ncbi:tRNA3(Ser)-specific nuclease WapA precursor [Stieleria neptunia]|uniref:tRNA3(Ser)-specific nuclease WapA n=1 Tax=Stieleria neptunia TaxID=2527979 RepID=A0A518HW37_9BACT|nr:tRNA3(Ser)-specific nuclease WapA precursor [Stieleria neptunia]
MRHGCTTSLQASRKSGKSKHHTCVSATNTVIHYHGTQQYSVTALTDSSGTIKERYAYDAYGGLSIFDGSGTARTSTAEGNRYTYTGREYDDVLDLYHYRARMYDPIAGRFCSRDPIGYADGVSQYLFVGASPLSYADPFGLDRCCIKSKFLCSVADNAYSHDTEVEKGGKKITAQHLFKAHRGLFVFHEPGCTDCKCSCCAVEQWIRTAGTISVG